MFVIISDDSKTATRAPVKRKDRLFGRGDSDIPSRDSLPETCFECWIQGVFDW